MRRLLVLAVLGAAACGGTLRAEGKLAGPFPDSMVLQP